jgi:hypothetical protein
MEIKGGSWCQSRRGAHTIQNTKNQFRNRSYGLVQRKQQIRHHDLVRFVWMCLNNKKNKKWPDPIGEWSDQPLYISNLHIANSVWELGRWALSAKGEWGVEKEWPEQNEERERGKKEWSGVELGCWDDQMTILCVVDKNRKERSWKKT